MLFEAAQTPTRQLTPTVGSPSKPRPGASVVEMDIFDTLRTKSNKWTSQEEDALDRKEAMDLCETDQQLLEWAIREVFTESQQYEENARKVLEEPGTKASKAQVQLQPLAYPLLVAELMKK